MRVPDERLKLVVLALPDVTDRESKLTHSAIPTSHTHAHTIAHASHTQSDTVIRYSTLSHPTTLSPYHTRGSTDGEICTYYAIGLVGGKRKASTRIHGESACILHRKENKGARKTVAERYRDTDRDRHSERGREGKYLSIRERQQRQMQKEREREIIATKREIRGHHKRVRRLRNHTPSTVYVWFLFRGAARGDAAGGLR